MKRTLKSLCAAAAVTGLCFGAAVASHAAWNGISYLNECNTAADVPQGAALVDDAADRAPDGSAYIKASDTSADWIKPDSSDMAFEAIFSSKALSTFCTWETDIKFTQEGAGFSIRNNTGGNSGNLNTTIVFAGDKIRFSKTTGSAICDGALNEWYHFKLVGVYGKGQDEGSLVMTISKYNASGTLDTVATVTYPGGKYGDVLRNDKAATRFVFNPGTAADNITAYEMPPAALTLTGVSQMNAGSEQQFSFTLFADAEKTLTMSGMDVVYELLNEDASDYLISDTITITPQGGLLTVAASAESQSFIVRAKCVDVPEVYDDVAVSVESQPMIEFVGAAFNDEYDTLVNLRFNQNYDNEGDISFIAAIYDENGRLLDVYNKTLAYKDQKEGDLIVTLNAPLPEGFDREKDTIKVFAWSKTVN